MYRAKNTISKVGSILWRVALYIRLSKEDGEVESLSVANQRERLMAYLEELMLQEDMLLVDVYIDDGFSGSNTDRDDFQRMMRDISEKKVNCVIVKDMSRFARSDWELKWYLQKEFVEQDVRFISMELPHLDTYKNPDDVYSLQTSFQSLTNENHCLETSIKIKGTLNSKRKRGESVASFAPYGYLKHPENKHRYVVNPETASVVQDIFKWYVYDGMSKSGITKKLIAEGVPSPSKYKQQNGFKYFNPNCEHGKGLWCVRTLDVILRNEVYLGKMVAGRHRKKSFKVNKFVAMPREDWYIVDDMHDAIIDEATFELAQVLIERNAKSAKHTQNVYPFSGFIKCADCKKGMQRRASRGYIYYACKTYVMYSKDMCTRHSLKHTDLEPAVLEAIRKQIDLVDSLAELIDEINDAPVVKTTSNRVNANLQQKNKALEKNLRLKDELYPDWKNGDISREEYHRLKKQFEDEEVELRRVIQELREEIEDMSHGIRSDDPCLATFLKYRNIDTIDRGLVVDLIDNIWVHEGGALTIDFRFADQHRRVIEFIQNNKHDLEVVGNVG